MNEDSERPHALNMLILSIAGRKVEIRLFFMNSGVRI